MLLQVEISRENLNHRRVLLDGGNYEGNYLTIPLLYLWVKKLMTFAPKHVGLYVPSWIGFPPRTTCPGPIPHLWKDV